MRGPARRAAALPTARWQALGTTIVMQAARQLGHRRRARAAVERELDAIDLACSRFRPDSELASAQRRLRALDGRRAAPARGARAGAAGSRADRRRRRPDRSGGRSCWRAMTGTSSSWPRPESSDAASRPAVTARVREGWREVVHRPRELGRAHAGGRAPGRRRDRQSVGRRPLRRPPRRRTAAAACSSASEATSRPAAPHRRAAGRCGSPTTTAATARRPARPSRSSPAALPPPAPRSGAGATRAGPCITSSTRTRVRR